MTDSACRERLLRIAQLSAELGVLGRAEVAPRARCIAILTELLELLIAQAAHEGRGTPDVARHH